MKILMLFIDMLSASRLQLCNPNAQKNELDKILGDVGGTVFSNCFSPAPDTPRSNAAVWSGVMPKKNHCNTRIKYPRYYLNDKIDNVWRMVDTLGLKKTIYASKIYLDTGLLPPDAVNNANVQEDGDLYRFLENADVQDDSFTYIALKDLHRLLEDYDFEPKYSGRAHSFMAKEVGAVFSKLNSDNFDLIVIYSDHGFMNKAYNVGSSNSRHLLDRERVQTYLQIYRRGDEGISIDGKLCSVMDIFPTMANYMGYTIQSQVDGIDLFSDKTNKYVIIEDHGDFTVGLGQPVIWWKIITNKGEVTTNCYGEWFPVDTSEKTKAKCREILTDKTDEYEQNTRQIEIWRSYKHGQSVSEYDTGEKRVKINQGIIGRIKNKVYYIKNNMLNKKRV